MSLTKKTDVGHGFRLLLEGQPLEGMARVVEQTEEVRENADRLVLHIRIDDASPRDVALVQSMYALAATGVNFVRLEVANYDPRDPLNELALALALMGSSPQSYENVLLREVQVSREISGRSRIQIVAEQTLPRK